MKQALLIAAVFLTGCATGYQTSAHFTGGFEELPLAPNVYKISFIGNGYTSNSRAENLALLRSADLTLQKGFAFFALADSQRDSTTSSFTTPVTANTNINVNRFGNTAYGTATTTFSGGQTFYISKPSSTNIVVMFHEKPTLNGMVFDAEFICNSIGPKYKAKCGAK